MADPATGDESLWRQCRNDSGYFEAFQLDLKRRLEAGAPTLLIGPNESPELCIHRGESIGERQCDQCGHRGNRAMVYICDKHGECIDKEGVKNITSCRWCQEYKEPEPEPIAWPFERVVGINLDRRPDRWRTFQRHFPGVERFAATDGWGPNMPKWWNAGGGAWGCRDSHVRAIRQAYKDGVESLLLLEDDAKPVAGFREKLQQVMANVPEDWEQLFLGGQYQFGNPQFVAPGVGRPKNVNRTHAWALKGEGIKRTLDFLEDLDHWRKYPTDHIDHRLGRMHTYRGVRVYSALPWIIIQGSNKSDIDGQRHGDRGWQPAGWYTPAWTVPRRPGIVRVGWLVSTVAHEATAERVAGMIGGLDRDRIEPVAVAVERDANQAFPPIPVRVTSDWRTVQHNSDVVIVWGARSLSPLRSIFRGPVVVMGWDDSNPAALARLAPLADRLVADSEAAREHFPRRMRRSVEVADGSDWWAEYLAGIPLPDKPPAEEIVVPQRTAIGETGAWQGPAVQEHWFDAPLAGELVELLRGRSIGSVLDLGCGPGRYVEALVDAGIDAHGIDGNDEAFAASCRQRLRAADLTEPLDETAREAVLSLEVGEHIPPELAAAYLDNLTGAATNLIVLSWAVPGQGGFGHVNERPNAWVKEQMQSRGWVYNGEASRRLRAASTLSWFKNTIMVFNNENET